MQLAAALGLNPQIDSTGCLTAIPTDFESLIELHRKHPPIPILVDTIKLEPSSSNPTAPVCTQQLLDPQNINNSTTVWENYQKSISLKSAMIEHQLQQQQHIAIAHLANSTNTNTTTAANSSQSNNTMDVCNENKLQRQNTIDVMDIDEEQPSATVPIPPPPPPLVADRITPIIASATTVASAGSKTKTTNDQFQNRKITNYSFEMNLKENRHYEQNQNNQNVLNQNCGDSNIIHQLNHYHHLNNHHHHHHHHQQPIDENMWRPW